MELKRRNVRQDDLTKSDLVDIRRHGHWHTNFEQILTLEYLKAKDFSEISLAKESTSHVEGLFVKYSLKDFFKENGFNIEKEVDINHDGEYPVSNSNIEYEYKKYRSCLYMGAYFLSKGSDRYIFDIDYGHRDTTIFRITSNVKSKLSGTQILQNLLNYSQKNNFLKGKKIDARCHFIKFDKKYTWADLIIDDKQKEAIRKNLANLIKYRDVYKANNIAVKRGLILSGSPGTGKTLTGKILCNIVDWTFIWVTPKHLEDSRDVARIIGMARDLSPSILFLEDIDLYGGDRHSNNKVGILGELMNQLDGIQENKDVITIATTNNVEVLEKALLKRPGRFDKVIEFGEPSKKSRAEMFKLFTKEVQLSKDVDFGELVNITNTLTGAELKELVNFAILQAIDDKSYGRDKKLILKNKHFLTSLTSVKGKDRSVGFNTDEDNDEDNDDQSSSLARNDLYDYPTPEPGYLDFD